MEEKKINREWVKTAAIIFLAVLLVLTFFSNTIMNRTLPEVASAEVTDGPITAKIRGTGTVSSVGQTEVKANATQSVATVKAREGAEVKAGDVLFVMGEAGEELENALEMLENARFDLMSAQSSFPGSVSSYEKDLARIDADDALAKYQAAVEASSKAKPDDDPSVIAAHDAVVNAQATYTFKDTETQKLMDDAYKLWSENPDDEELKKAYEESVSSRETTLTEAQREIDKAQAAYVTILAQTKSKLSIEEQTALEVWEELERIASREEDIYNQSVQSNNKSAASSSNQIYSEYLSADSTDKNNGKAAQSANIAVARAQADINRWEKKVAELSGGEDYAIKAPIGGTISALSVSPGEKVSKDQVMCIIEVPDLGYQMSFSVTNDQVKRIKVGDPATVSSFFWGSTIEAEVSSIKVDPKDPQSKKLITCTLDGDVEPGSEISVSIGNKSANYDVIVPNSAVRTDSNGSFVLMITSKNSPLGNRYFAERVPVEVLASDDTNSALNANLGYGDFVITTSSSPIKNGDQVRMADNG